MRRALSLGALIFALLVLAVFAAVAEEPARSSAAAGEAGACVYCHDGNPSTPQPGVVGLAAHLPVEAMLRGQGALGVAEMTSPHLPPEGEEPPCASCHGPQEAAGAGGEPRSCFQPRCHGGMDEDALEALVDQRQAEIGGLMEELRAALDAVADRDSRAYQVALANLAFVEADGSLGLHNYAYAKAALESSLRLIQAAPGSVTPGSVSGGGREVSPIASWMVTGMLAFVPGSVAFLWRRRWLQ